MPDISDICVKRIVGNPPTSSVPNVAVVIQGPYIAGHTRTVIEETLRRNSMDGPILIILSTYLSIEEERGEKPPGSFLSSDEERNLITSGILVLVLVKAPSREEYPDFWKTNHHNRNLQRLTSFAGIRYAHFSLGIKFTLKLRSDTFLGRHGIIDHLRREVETEFPLRKKSGEGDAYLKGRIVVSGQGTITNPRTWVPDPFHVRDHWYFGYTVDLLNFFDMSTTRSIWKDDGSELTSHNPESSLTQLWMKNIGIKVKTPAELVGKYMITEDASFVEQVRLDPRTPGWFFDYPRYLAEGVEYLKILYSEDASRCCVTSHDDWLKLQSTN